MLPVFEFHRLFLIVGIDTSGGGVDWDCDNAFDTNKLASSVL
jgi:hypothetical protein